MTAIPEAAAAAADVQTAIEILPVDQPSVGAPAQHEEQVTQQQQPPGHPAQAMAGPAPIQQGQTTDKQDGGVNTDDSSSGSCSGRGGSGNGSGGSGKDYRFYCDHEEAAAAVEGTDLCAALNDLVGDVYAVCVRYIVTCYRDGSEYLPKSFVADKRMKFAWLISAAMFTFLLQFTLIILLWSAASTGKRPMTPPTTDLLWQQVGSVNQFLCRWQQYTREQQGTRLVLPNTRSSDCRKWWPDEFLVDYPSAAECLSRPLGTMASGKQCLRAMLVLNSSMMAYGRGLFFNGTTRAVEQKRNNSNKNNTNATETLFFGDQLDPVARVDPVFFIMFAYIQLAVCVHQEFKQGVWLCYMAAGCVGILPKFFGQLTRRPDSEWHIVDFKKAEHRMPFPLNCIVLLMPILQVLGSLAVLATGGVLFLFEQTNGVDIIINSVALAFILDIDNKIGVIMGQREDWWYRVPEPPPIQPGMRPTAAISKQDEEQHHRHQEQWQARRHNPSTLSARHSGTQCLSSRGDKVTGVQPGLARAQQKHTAAADASPHVSHATPAAAAAAGGNMQDFSRHQGAPTTRTKSYRQHAPSWHWQWARRLKAFAGYAYMSIVGALIYAEVIFLAPQSAAQLLSFVVVAFKAVGTVDGGAVTNGVGIVPAFLENVHLMTADWFPTDSVWYSWSFKGILAGFHSSQEKTFSELAGPQLGKFNDWIIMAYAMYCFTTVLFVVLLCVRILPSCSRYYTYALVCTQLLLVVVAQAQDSTWQDKCNVLPLVGKPDYDDESRRQCPRNFWWVIVLGTYFSCWVFMFWVVPVSMGFPQWIFTSCRAFRSGIKKCVCCCKWRPSSKKPNGSNARDSTQPSTAGSP